MIHESGTWEARVTGRTLLHYNIVEKLGEGGMGVVWKARDTHLDRFVAVKVLPADKLKDAERQRRFVQEAKAASALNHPNIVHIYDIAEADGTPFIAMEYVAGKTLDQTIGRKGLRVTEALRYSVQIADALEKAHAAGIVHRDLKPSNIMVTPDGLVKILDFGLAKLTEPARGDFGETRTVREAGPATEEGAIVGTVAYMSPDQAEGREVDGRSDIFSFGAMLYEMITGRRAFHGDSKLSTLSAILKEEPEALPPEVPRDLEKIIARCLRKDAGRRYQHADDLRLALLELKEESDSGKLGVPVTVGATTRRERLWWVLAAALLLVAVGLGTWMRWFRSTTVAARKIVPLTSYPGQQTDPALSPDGKQVAFAWNGEKGDNFDIYVKLVDAGTPLRLTTNAAPEYRPAWSPDGRFIAFYRESDGGGAIFMVPALGGPERRLGQSTWAHFGDSSLSWSPDGKFLAITDRVARTDPPGIFLLSVETGEKQRLTSPAQGYAGDCCPVYSPDGKALAFTRAHGLLSNDLYVVRIAAGSKSNEQPQRLTRDERNVFGVDWTADGRNIVFSSDRSGSSGGLWLIPASGGAPERLPIGGENARRISVSRSGSRLAYERVLVDLNIWRIAGPNSTDRSGLPVRWVASTQQEGEEQFSPDGNRIAFSSNRSGNFEIWVCDHEGRNPVQLTSWGGPIAGSPRWSPDSRWIAFDYTKEGNRDIFVINAEGGPARRVTRETSNNGRPSWSRDGRWIYFGSNQSGISQIWKIPAQGGTAVQVTRSGGREAFESADAKFVYYAKSDALGIWRTPAQGGEETQVLDQVRIGQWALNSHGICFIDTRSPAGPTIQRYDLVTRQLRLIHQFPKQTVIGGGDTSITVSPDGRWILYTQLDQIGSDLMMVENFR